MSLEPSALVLVWTGERWGGGLCAVSERARPSSVRSELTLSGVSIWYSLEREYAKKLSEAAGKARSAAVKDALARGGGGNSK